MDYDGITGIFRPNVRSISWVNGKSIPPDEPKCGFHNEKLACQPKGIYLEKWKTFWITSTGNNDLIPSVENNYIF